MTQVNKYHSISVTANERTRFLDLVSPSINNNSKNKMWETSCKMTHIRGKNKKHPGLYLAGVWTRNEQFECLSFQLSQSSVAVLTPDHPFTARGASTARGRRSRPKAWGPSKRTRGPCADARRGGSWRSREGPWGWDPRAWGRSTGGAGHGASTLWGRAYAGAGGFLVGLSVPRFREKGGSFCWWSVRHLRKHRQTFLYSMPLHCWGENVIKKRCKNVCIMSVPTQQVALLCEKNVRTGGERIGIELLAFCLESKNRAAQKIHSVHHLFFVDFNKWCKMSETHEQNPNHRICFLHLNVPLFKTVLFTFISYYLFV